MLVWTESGEGEEEEVGDRVTLGEMGGAGQMADMVDCRMREVWRATVSMKKKTRTR
jgi:hypothetical protein